MAKFNLARDTKEHVFELNRTYEVYWFETKLGDYVFKSVSKKGFNFVNKEREKLLRKIIYPFKDYDITDRACFRLVVQYNFILKQRQLKKAA